MTPPSVSEEMIRAALKDARSSIITGFDTIPTLAKIEAALEGLAHLPAGSEAVKPVAWVAFRDGDPWFPRAFSSEEESRNYVARYNCGNLPYAIAVFAAPPSTPPASNVPEEDVIDEMARAILFRGDDQGDDAWTYCQPWLREGALIQARAALALLRSKQAPTVAVPDLLISRERLREQIINSPDDEDVEVRPARAEQREATSAVLGEGWAEVARLMHAMDVQRKAAVDYCWQRYKGRDPLNLKAPATFTSHEWQKIGEAMDAAVLAAAPTSDGR